jgi:hypothetical protein
VSETAERYFILYNAWTKHWVGGRFKQRVDRGWWVLVTHNSGQPPSNRSELFPEPKGKLDGYEVMRDAILTPAELAKWWKKSVVLS